ncbi:MAG TPA: glycosyltransferase, partial [Methylophilaceae bacterium]|nr:glycosyltransferase [Methylophilaceae bacterium]
TWLSIGKLRRILRNFKPELIQGWMYHGNLFASTIGGMGIGGKRLPVLWNIRHSLDDMARENLATRLLLKLHRLFAPFANTIIYNSSRSCDQHSRLGLPTSRSLVIGNGFDIQQWQPNLEMRKTLRHSLGLTDAHILIGHVARFHPLKGHANFLQAMQHVMATDERVHMLLVGRDVTPENPALQSFFSKLPPERTHSLGERNDIERIMPALDIFCLSSSSEAFPNVVGEAMACGIPCVTTDVGDCREIVGQTGMVAPSQNPEHLGLALLSLSQLSALQRTKLGHIARIRITENFSIGRVVQRYHQLYADILSTPIHIVQAQQVAERSKKN